MAQWQWQWQLAGSGSLVKSAWSPESGVWSLESGWQPAAAAAAAAAAAELLQQCQCSVAGSRQPASIRSSDHQIIRSSSSNRIRIHPIHGSMNPSTTHTCGAGFHGGLLVGKKIPTKNFFVGIFFGHFEGYPRPKLGHLEPMLGHVAPMLGPCWGIWWAIYMGFHGGLLGGKK